MILFHNTTESILLSRVAEFLEDTTQVKIFQRNEIFLQYIPAIRGELNS